MSTPHVQGIRHRYNVVGVNGQPVEVSGDVIDYLDTEITFTGMNGLQKFTLPMPGSFGGTAIVVCTPLGDPDVNGDLVGVQGAYNDGAGNCVVLAYYPGLAASITQPIRIMWIV